MTPAKAKTIFSSLNPAALFLILNEEEKTPFKEYIKFTLADLILKKVLEINFVKRRPHPRDAREHVYPEVSRGANYLYYKPSNFEKTFVNAISEGKSMVLNVFITHVYNYAPTDGKFKTGVIKDSELKAYFRPVVLGRITGNFNLNKTGLMLKEECENTIHDAELNIVNFLHKPEQLFELIEHLGGNIFFLPNLNQELWNSMCETMKKMSFSPKIMLDNHNLNYLDHTYYTPEIFRNINLFLKNIDRFLSLSGSFMNTTFEWD